MGFVFAILAGFFAAAYNLCLRKSVGVFQTARAFLMVELWVAGAFSVLLHPIFYQSYFFNIESIIFAAVTGLIFGAMLYFIGKAMQYGPAGLTIACLNSSNVFPGLIMACVFGASLGFDYTIFQAIGSVFVVAGIFWASWDLSSTASWKRWFFYCTAAFICHILFLAFMQWKAFMLDAPATVTYLRLISKRAAASHWFVPVFYFTAAYLHTAIFKLAEKRKLRQQERLYGTVGGVLNAGYAFCILLSTKYASPIENAMIFPVFSVVTILLCNLWGRWIYQENIHWKGCFLLILGLFLGTIDWITFVNALIKYS